VEGNNPAPKTYAEEAELLRAMNLSREEAKFQMGV
jgi:hypothetical protein